MTTANLKGIEALRKSITDSVVDVRARAASVVSSADAVKERSAQEQADAAIAARLLQQAADDELVPLDEEAGQLARILNGDPVTPAPVAEVPSTPAVSQTSDSPTVAIPAAVPQPSPPDPSTTVTTRRSWWQVREWSRVQKGVATIGLIVGFFVGLATADWANNDLVGGGAAVFNIFWVLLVALFCFFAVGFIVGLFVPPDEVVAETTTTTTTTESAPAGSS